MALLNVCLSLHVGCADEGSSAVAEGASVTPNVAVDPQSVADLSGTSKLTDAERELLARARGRTWEPLGIHDVRAYLSPLPDSASALYLWNPTSGPGGLAELQDLVRGVDTSGVRVAVGVYAGGRSRYELVALRESQLVLPAFEVPIDGDFSWLPDGRPKPGSLLLRGAGGGPLTVYGPEVAREGYPALLIAHAPR